MTFDFRASQLRTSKIIASGSTGTNAKLLIYPIGSQGSPNNQGVIDSSIFGTGSVGSDAFIFISGSINSLNQSGNGAVVFGGDTYVSGNIKTGRRLSFHAGVTASGTLDAAITSSNRTWTFPDADGNVALTNKILAGTNITINTGATGTLYISASSGGGSGGSSIVFQTVAGYSTTTFGDPGTICGQFYHTSSLIPSSSVKLRAILTAATSSNTAVVKLYNHSMGGYIELDGPGVYSLSSSSESPAFLESTNLLADPFWTDATVYEVQLYSSNSSGLVTLGSAQIVYT